jgi:Tannase and feruloyl esterase
MGQSAADTVYRLYLFPGAYHCGGGGGPATFDLLSPLIAWTETGTPPEIQVGGIVDSASRHDLRAQLLGYAFRATTRGDRPLTRGTLSPNISSERAS